MKRGLFAELKRRNVLRAAALYAAGAWLLVQIVTQVGPVFDLPPATQRWIIIAAIIGFPFWCAFAWAYEWTPQGLKRESEVAADTSIVRSTGRKMDRAIIVVLAIAVVMLLADRFVMHRDGANVTAVTAASDRSIAVLPFTDLSPQHDQEYFSDGMAEEILNALAQVRDLKVAGRTSSFQFKGKNEDLRTIGHMLGVASVLEGSVRKQGDKLRITAQLIRASNGFHLWSNSYDGDLKDVFELQERIARAITEQLQVVIADDQRTRLVPIATTSPEAHELYLQATAVFNHRDGEKMVDAIAKLAKATQLDPNFARAHSRAAALGAIVGSYTGVDVDKTLAAAEQEANLAIDLDPTLAEPHAALATIYGYRRHWVAAFVELERAAPLDPNDSNAIFWRGLALIDTGYVTEGIAAIDKSLKIDPLLPNALAWRSFWYLNAGDRESSRRLAQLANEQGLPFSDRYLGMIAHEEGRDADAVTLFAHGTRYSYGGFPNPDEAARALAEGVYGEATAKPKAVAMIDAYLAAHPKSVGPAAPWALLLLREPARALAVGQDPRTIPDTLFLSWLWSKWGADARKLPQFPEFARKLGFVELWDQRGPPDTCRRIAPGDYACD